MCTHAHCTHAHMHTCTHARMHACTHSCTHSCTQERGLRPPMAGPPCFPLHDALWWPLGQQQPERRRTRQRGGAAQAKTRAGGKDHVNPPTFRRLHARPAGVRRHRWRARRRREPEGLVVLAHLQFQVEVGRVPRRLEIDAPPGLCMAHARVQQREMFRVGTSLKFPSGLRLDSRHSGAAKLYIHAALNYVPCEHPRIPDSLISSKFELRNFEILS